MLAWHGVQSFDQWCVCVRVRVSELKTPFKTSLHASLSILFLPRPPHRSIFPLQTSVFSQSVSVSLRFFQRPAGDNRVVMRRQLKCVVGLLLLLAALSPVAVVATARRGKLNTQHTLLSDHGRSSFPIESVTSEFRQFVSAQCGRYLM